jgi:DNA-binding HxlR family transcriptional regulator
MSLLHFTFSRRSGRIGCPHHVEIDPSKASPPCPAAEKARMASKKITPACRFRRHFAVESLETFEYLNRKDTIKNTAMPATKEKLFTTKDQKLAKLARALSHPARVAILRTLSKRNECICGEIVAVLPLAQATISQHLKELKSVGLIKGEINGPRSCYCIDEKSFDECKKMLEDFFAELM